ncbi:hypothetical protein D3C75_581040 [compost metagenome]
MKKLLQVVNDAALRHLPLFYRGEGNGCFHSNPYIIRAGHFNSRHIRVQCRRGAFTQIGLNFTEQFLTGNRLRLVCFRHHNDCGCTGDEFQVPVHGAEAFHLGNLGRGLPHQPFHVLCGYAPVPALQRMRPADLSLVGLLLVKSAVRRDRIGYRIQPAEAVPYLRYGSCSDIAGCPAAMLVIAFDIIGPGRRDHPVPAVTEHEYAAASVQHVVPSVRCGQGKGIDFLPLHPFTLSRCLPDQKTLARQHRCLR